MSDGSVGGWDCHVHVFDAARPVRDGHYRPAHHPLASIEAQAATHGVGHLVLVQPSVYGQDNSLLLAALADSPGRHRGVVVVDDGIDDRALDRMHALGVRGIRFNLVSPAGETAVPAARFAHWAPRLRARGWHVQWYAGARDLARIGALHANGDVGCVIDHLGGLGTRVAADDPAWQALAVLAEQGAWIKLSGWYRLDASLPYDALLPAIRRVVALFDDRVCWGSDWPHTAFGDGQAPPYEATWWPVVAALGESAAVALRTRCPAPYR